MVIADDGRIFFTERPGQIREIRNGKVREEPLLSLPAPFISEGEGGLLGLALDPDFQTNHFMYTYHSYEENEKIKNRVLRLLVDDNQARIDKVILDGIVGDTNHNGGRIKIGPDGMLYITAGDRYEPDLAQDRTSMGGKIFRIHPDGSIPDDNPIKGSPVYSYGHRNPQGLAWHPVTGDLFSSEHGQSAHDEINLIEAGKNYGWPIIQGDESKEGMETPIAQSATETWAPSGMTFVSKGEWKNQLLVANLRGMQVLKVELDELGKQVKRIESLFKDEYGRIRNIIEAPDGSLYMMTNNRDGRGNPSDKDDRIIRLIPKTGI
ncbi:glucose sorbosone dehydrogenase [Bacillus sp. FJAT-27986]|nr:glucose sorbosone dehydrogenase [Bacillus sp. FJAT-27986]